MPGIPEGGSYSRDPKSGALTRRTDTVEEVTITVPAETKVVINKMPPATATNPKRGS